MGTAIIIRGANLLFSENEENDIKKLCSEKGVDIIFFDDDAIQASWGSFLEIILNNQFLKAIMEGIAVDLLKEIVFKTISAMKEKKIIKLTADGKKEEASLTIKASTKMGNIYLEVPKNVTDEKYQEGIKKIIEAKKLLDVNVNSGIKELYIVEDSFGNIEIMTLLEYIEYKNRSK